MKFLLIISALSTTIFFSCSKSDAGKRAVNCDSLITDMDAGNEGAKLFLPLAFTPNGDGLNDVFRPIAINIASMVFTVYDESNKVVFTTGDLSLATFSVSLSGTDWKKFYFRVQAVTTAGKNLGICGEVTALKCFPKSVNRSSLTFEDQLTSNGFTRPTSERIRDCP